MNFDDLFDKTNSIPKGEFGKRPPFESPLFNPRNIEDQPKKRTFGLLLAAVTLLFLFSLLQGTLVWLGFRFVENLGFIDRELPWDPFVMIAFTINLIRVIDRALFAKR